jgi:hypothetical protein
MVTLSSPLPALSPEEAKAERARYIAEWNAAMTSATPAERELEELSRKTRLTASELSRFNELSARSIRAA